MLSRLLFLVCLVILPSLEAKKSLWQGELKTYISKEDYPKWMVDQVDEDLAPFSQNGFRQADLISTLQRDEKRNHKSQLVLYFIRSGKVFHMGNYENSRIEIVEKILSNLLETCDLPDMTLLISMHDSIRLWEFDVPVFAFAKRKTTGRNILLIPDPEVALASSKHLRKQLRKGDIPWENKKEIAYWRGATSGGHYTPENFLTFYRSQAVTQSLFHPGEIDARFVMSVSHMSRPKEVLALYDDYFDQKRTIPEHLRYKYLLLIDGNTCAFARGFWVFHSNSLVLKRDSPEVQWYYRALAPYRHYVPFAFDSSDLVEKVAWARSHDAECKKMAKRSTRFMEKNLSEARIYQYVYLLLTRYAQLEQN